MDQRRYFHDTKLQDIIRRVKAQREDPKNKWIHEAYQKVEARVEPTKFGMKTSTEQYLRRETNPDRATSSLNENILDQEDINM